MKLIKRTKSLISGKKNLQHLYTLKNFPVFMGCVNQNQKKDLKVNMSFSICKDSGFIQLDYLLPLKIVYQYPHNDGIGLIWQEHYLAFTKFLEKIKPINVLEIGGANATIAKEYTKKNLKTQWTIVEPNPLFEGNKRITVIKKWFDKKFIAKILVDTIIHTHVLEHVYDPIQFMKNISSFLRTGDKHVFSVPNMFEQLSRKYTNCLNFEHTTFLTEYFVDYILSKCGFKILEKEYFKNHSIFYNTEKIGGKYSPDLINHYKEYKEIFNNFISYHLDLIKDLNTKINDFPGSVYLFGAHIFSQYLLGFGLNSKKINGILDNSLLKVGKRLYGSDLLVYSPEIIRNKGKVAVILKVGIYRDEILKQLKKINPKIRIFE